MTKVSVVIPIYMVENISRDVLVVFLNKHLMILSICLLMIVLQIVV